MYTEIEADEQVVEKQICTYRMTSLLYIYILYSKSVPKRGGLQAFVDHSVPSSLVSSESSFSFMKLCSTVCT